MMTQAAKRNFRSFHEDLPELSVDLDDIFRRYDRIYIVGDLHDNEEALRTFLVANDLCFIFGNFEEINFHDLRNYFLKANVLLVFLGDILYKTINHFKSIARFLLNNLDNCLLILGNNEVKFVYQHIGVFLEVCRPIIPRQKYEVLARAHRQGNNFEVVKSVYSLLSWYRTCSKNNYRLKQWNRFYEELKTDYFQDKEKLEDLMIIIYILTESIIVGVSACLKLILVHAGFNPKRRLCDQRIVDLCNIRLVAGTGNPWFEYYNNSDYLICYGHWSQLTTEGSEIRPYIHQKTVCLDTGCCYTNVLSYLFCETRFVKASGTFELKESVKTINKFRFHGLHLFIL